MLELGAGAGLPAIVAAYLGAEQVLVTDYPDADLVENLEWNIRENCPQTTTTTTSNPDADPQPRIIHATGHRWGADPTPLLHHCPGQNGFDTLLLADLLFNHHCHEQLLDSVCAMMRKCAQARALVFFTPYRPWLLERDLAFFGSCKGRGLGVSLVVEEMMEGVMFAGDRGDEELRRRVWGYEVFWGE